jgi:hypothetical protein
MKFTYLKATVLLVAVSLSHIANADLIGHWTFEGNQPLVDQTGHFGNIELFGNANINNGYLDVNGNGDWARSSNYQGNTILDKTLVSWVSLESLNIRSGSVLSLDGVTNDSFDGIVYGERTPHNQWINGSSYWSRTGDFTTGTAVQNALQALAITYDDLDDIIGGSMRIEGFLNGISIGSYTSNNSSNWQSGNAEALFGARHSIGNSPTGALDAKIYEARIYNTALSTADVQQLQMTSVPEPSTLAIFALGIMGLASRRFMKKS